MVTWSQKQYIFWISISYLLLSSFIIKKSIFTLPNLILLGGLLAFLTSTSNPNLHHQLLNLLPLLSLIFPISIFNNVISCKTYIFRRNFIPSLILASISYFIQIIILSIILTIFTTIHSFFKNCLISILIFATDTFSISNILHKIPQKLIFQNLIQGQSILIVGFGLSFLRICNQINYQQQIHSTLFLIDIFKQWIGAIGFAFLVYYVFNKLKIYLLETKVMFQIVLIMTSYFIAYFYFDFNEITTITSLGILGKMRYKSGYNQIESQRYISLIHNSFVILASLIIGFIDYQNQQITILTFLQIFGVYLLQVIIRGIAVFLVLPLIKYFKYNICQQQVLLTVFGSMKGINNIVLLFFALLQVQQQSIKAYLVRYCVHIILINNVISNLVLYKLKKFRKAQGNVLLENKESLTKVKKFIQNQIFQVDKKSIFLNSQTLKYQTGLDQLYKYQKFIQIVSFDRLRQSSNIQLNQLLIFQELYIALRSQVVKQLKKKIQIYMFSYPKQYKILRQFFQMQQQHPDSQIIIFRNLMFSFLSIKIMKLLYKTKNCYLFVYQIYKTLSEQIQFILNICQIYQETLQITALSIRLTKKYSIQYKTKIIQQIRDQIYPIQQYIQIIYSQLPGIIDQIQNIKLSRQIILKVKYHINNIYEYGQLTQYSKKQFFKLFHIHEVRLNNAIPFIQNLSIIQMLKRHKIFCTLNQQQLKQILSEATEATIQKNRDIIENKVNKIINKEIFFIIQGSFRQKLNDNIKLWKKKGEFLKIPYIVYPSDRYLQQSIIAITRSKVLKIQIEKVRKVIQKNQQFLHKIYQKSIYYFLQKYIDKGGDLSYYPEDSIKILTRNSKLIFIKYNQKLVLEYGGYVLSGEIVSQQNRSNYLKGICRYDQFSYVLPSKENLIVMRQSLILKFQNELKVQIF